MNANATQHFVCVKSGKNEAAITRIITAARVCTSLFGSFILESMWQIKKTAVVNTNEAADHGRAD